MEKAGSYKDLGKRPLPGERQGTSGVGAGRDSIGDTDPVMLMRRAHRDKEATAQHNMELAGSALLGKQATTKAGKPQQRMKWTTEMNEYIMHCYYSITKNETDMGAYRPLLHQAFLEKYPERQVTQQRIADQKHAIFRRNLIPEARLAQIRQEVARELQMCESEDPAPQPAHDIQELVDQMEKDHPDSDTDSAPNVCLEVAPENQASRKLMFEFKAALMEFEGTDPLLRPSIPRQSSSRRLAEATRVMNSAILPVHLMENVKRFGDLQTSIFSAAVAIVRATGGRVSGPQRSPPPRKKKPAWEYRLSREVENLRIQIGRLHQYIAGNRSRKMVECYRGIRDRMVIHTKQEPPNSAPELFLDTLRQRLSVKANRLRRYRESAKRREHNTLFSRIEKSFYRSLRESKGVKVSQPPTSDEVEEFWSGIWANEIEHEEDATWIKSEEDRVAEVPVMGNVEFTVEDVTSAVNKSQNWKAPGPDGIHNFWLKRLPCVLPYLARFFTSFIDDPGEIPVYMTKGKTLLLPKDGDDTQDPSKYRPITCLCTLYKILTSCIADKIYCHLDQHSVMATEQKGCIKMSRGCKEQLVIDAVVMEQAYYRSRNIFTAFIDYRKAYDSVPHSWLTRVLEIYKVAPGIVGMLRHLMLSWETTLYLYHSGGSIQSRPVPIKRGIFQGDSLSPLWFCLALNPLSALLNNTRYGFLIKGTDAAQYKLTHLLYVDDIKLYGATETQIASLLRLTEGFSNDIRMSFGLDKCRTLSIEGGRVIQRGFELVGGGNVSGMDRDEAYKYLGLQQTRRVQHKDIRRRVTDVYLQRVSDILGTRLNGRNLFKALNTFAIPVLTYTFGVVKWTRTELESVERATRRLLTKNRVHHPRSALERITLPRCEGGRGLIDIGRLCEKQIRGLQVYFARQNTALHQAVKKSDNKYTPLDLLHDGGGDFETDLAHVQRRKQEWLSKPLHGRHANILGQPCIDVKASNGWLERADIFAETEGFMVAIQDQVIATKNYLKYIVRADLESDQCRRCRQQPETIQHITGACQTLVATEYLARHNQVAKIVHQSLARQHGLLSEELPYYRYVPSAVLENDTHKLYWDRSVLTDRTVVHNRPDIILMDKGRRETLLIDVGVPNSHNIQSYFAEKEGKYQRLGQEIQQMWRQEKVAAVPLIISTTGVIPKTLITNLGKLGIADRIAVIQKAVILSTTSMVRSFLNYPP